MNSTQVVTVGLADPDAEVAAASKPGSDTVAASIAAARSRAPLTLSNRGRGNRRRPDIGAPHTHRTLRQREARPTPATSTGSEPGRHFISDRCAVDPGQWNVSDVTPVWQNDTALRTHITPASKMHPHPVSTITLRRSFGGILRAKQDRKILGPGGNTAEPTEPGVNPLTLKVTCPPAVKDSTPRLIWTLENTSLLPTGDVDEVDVDAVLGVPEVGVEVVVNVSVSRALPNFHR